jgi:ABC-type transporter Mla MlaB component
VRKVYSGDKVYSKKIRSQAEMKILLEKGSAIKIYELNGSLFFGTCDKLMSEIDTDLNSFIVILDFKRVHTIDLTGAQLLKQVVEGIHEKGNHLLISYLDNQADEDKQRMRRLMKDVGVIGAIGEAHFFQDTDHAQEWAEDSIILREREASKIERQKLAVKSLSVFQDLDDEQLEQVREHMHPKKFKKDEVVFSEGDPGDKIYFLLSGEVSVLTSVAGNGRARRLATFGEGVFFGDMAILENKPRSATVRADSDAEVIYMTVTDFEKLVDSHPLLASKMLLGMSRELSYRLRLTNTEIRALEE